MAAGRKDFDFEQAAEFAAYVSSLTAELSRLARRHHLSTLAYLLEMTLLEARGITRASSLRGSGEGTDTPS
ncbi:hypothetical protein V5F77_08185 [Xanthobacter sp. DSM 24535]|uniref:hypothetical protein n=1 Tax=Roseixanthobacter psychrophilus TaxID=3119917 RepID=UPI0037294445